MRPLLFIAFMHWVIHLLRQLFVTTPFHWHDVLNLQWCGVDLNWFFIFIYLPFFLNYADSTKSGIIVCIGACEMWVFLSDFLQWCWTDYNYEEMWTGRPDCGKHWRKKQMCVTRGQVWMPVFWLSEWSILFVYGVLKWIRHISQKNFCFVAMAANYFSSNVMCGVWCEADDPDGCDINTRTIYQKVA